MGYTDEPSKQGSARRAEATIGDDEEEQPEGITEPKAATDLQASNLTPQDEPLGSGLDSSSLVDEVAEELQYLQLPWEQPQLGLADDRDNMSNKEPLHKCCMEDDDAIKGSAEDPEQLKQLRQGVP